MNDDPHLLLQRPAPVAHIDAAKLAFEVALRYYTPAELQQTFRLSSEQYRILTMDARFERAVLGYQRQIDEAGTQFKVKARKLASLVVDELGSIALDPSVDAGDRINAIRELARFAGYTAASDESPHNQFAIQINMAPAQ